MAFKRFGEVAEDFGSQLSVERDFSEFSARLGEILPDIGVANVSPADLATFQQLGKTTGGYLPQFQDLAELGWVSNDVNGFARALAYNKSGLGVVAKNLPEYAGWAIAAQYAYAVANRMHQGNNLSPLWDANSAQAAGQKAIMSTASNAKWTPAQLTVAQDSFASHYPRLLAKWGAPAASSAPVAMILHPYFLAKGQQVYIPANTVKYNGPNRDPSIQGGFEFEDTAGNIWHWGGTAAPLPTTDYLQVIVDGNDVKYDAQVRTLYGTRGWWVFTKDSKGTITNQLPVKKWTGAYVGYGNLGPNVNLVFAADLQPTQAQQLAAAQGGFSSPPPSPPWQISNTLLPAPPAGTPPSSSSGPTTQPLPPIAVDTGISTSSGVGPVGAGVDFASSSLDNTAAPSSPPSSPPNPAAALPALGGGLALIAGLGLLMLLRKKR